MNPLEFINTYISVLKSKTVKDNTKKYTQAEVDKLLVDTLERVKGFVEEGMQYKIVAEFIDGARMYSDQQSSAKITEIDDMYIIQPLTPMNVSDMEELMTSINNARQNGEFEDKSILLLPYDIRVLRACVDIENPIPEKEIWDIS